MTMDDITRRRLELGLIQRPPKKQLRMDLGPTPKKPPPPKMPKPVREKATHRCEVLLVGKDGEQWLAVARGSRKEMFAYKATLMEPTAPTAGRRYRVAPMPPRASKGWSVKDADHVAKGSAVLLKRTVGEIYPSLVDVRRALGGPPVPTTLRATVTHRYYGSGRYMVQPDGSKLSINVDRSDFFFPVPEGVVPIGAARRSR